MRDGDGATTRNRVDWRVVGCTAAALVGFAGNSLLTRAGIGSGAIDAASFTTVRLATGALTLWLLLQARSEGRSSLPRGWRPAAALASYMVAFSFSYVRVGASLGALLLFGSVQLTMMGWSVWCGERPRWQDWAGLTLAFAGLVLLVAPGLAAPDALGAAWMIAAGVSWGAYSLIGRGVADPLAVTTAAFVRALPVACAINLASIGALRLSATGLLLAGVSGVLASGVGYTLWYTALPALSSWRAGVLQLLVPVLTAVGAVALLGELVTARLMWSALLILAGVAWPLTIRRER